MVDGGAVWHLSNIDKEVPDDEIKCNTIIDLCNLVCIIAKAFGDASYKLFISSISIFSQTQSADPLTPVPIQAEPEVEPEPEAEPEAESEAEPEAESEAEPEAEPILCLIASQDRQFIRFNKNLLTIKSISKSSYENIFKTNLQARLTLLCNGSGHIEQIIFSVEQ